MRLFCFLLSTYGIATDAFIVSPEAGRCFGKSRRSTSRLSVTLNPDRSESCTTSRRRLLRGTATVASAVLLNFKRAGATDELYRPNPLTNPFLEQIRIWEQAEADELRYGGELERGDAGNRGKVDAYPKLLVPILEMASELFQVRALVHDSSVNWKKALTLVSQDKYDKVPFKKIFNAYGDNIYYSDPDRANLYLGGGATPRNEQSLAYLLRNDILTNVEALRAELEYLVKDTTPDAEKEETEDLFAYADTAVTAMAKYLELVPPGELKAAKEYLARK